MCWSLGRGDATEQARRLNAEDAGRKLTHAPAQPEQARAPGAQLVRKVPLELLVTPGGELAARALEFGARKYKPYGYREGTVTRMDQVNAALRHIQQYLAGQDRDHESGEHPLSHAAARLLIVLDMIALNIGKDDRWKP